ncbi:hypothetical protein N658DRAFT_227953 [Parathielavia hyrcaniae]|uniref:Uncharacterized protein n=1 Tax=Parathielavia hyrcaniae TaxID=113614 RepID=A0AAN6SY83_9PEZI|nr:hypothetical protein N658DRAFT_227953 [Parathielavia hyrcaniae]
MNATRQFLSTYLDRWTTTTPSSDIRCPYQNTPSHLITSNPIATAGSKTKRSERRGAHGRHVSIPEMSSLLALLPASMNARLLEHILALTKRHGVRRRQSQKKAGPEGRTKAPKPGKQEGERQTNLFHTPTHHTPIPQQRPVSRTNKSRSIRIPCRPAAPQNEPNLHRPTDRPNRLNPTGTNPTTQRFACHAPELLPECLPNQTRQFPK